jgi:SAM-dependent methyltransferase
VLNSDGPHFKALLRLLVQRGYRFHIPNGLRATALDDEVLDLMKAGSAALITSMETPDCDLLRLHINKGILPDEVTSLARRCQEKKLPLKIHYVIGMPGETVRQVNATLTFAAHLYDRYGAQPLVQIATPIPGTQMQREASAAGQLTLPLEDIAAQLPVLFQARSVISTPGLPAETVTAMQERFQRYVVAQHPLELTVVPGYGCNNHCHHCMVRGLEAPKRSLEEHLEAVREAASRGVRTLVVEGGEPTLYPQLFELLRGAREAGMNEVMVETNGRRCAYLPYARGLLDAGVTMLFVTFQGGNAGDHDRVTRAPGSFQQGVQGLGNLLACGFENLAVNLSLHRHLLVGDGLAAAVEGFARLGVRRFMLQYPTPFGAFGGQARALPRYEEVAGPLTALFARFPQLELKVMNVPFCALPGHEEHVHPDLNNIGRLPLDGAGHDEAIVTLLACGKVKDGRCEACPYGFLCSGFLEGKLGAGGGAGEEALVSNSLDFVQQERLPGFVPQAVGCQGAGLPLGGDPLRRVLLLGDGGATVYESESGDFGVEELAVLKHEAQQLYLDVSGKVALDDFQADLRQLRLAAVCRDCGLRRGCATAWEVDPALPFGAQETWLEGQLGGLRGRVLDLGCGELRYRELVGRLVASGALEYHGVEPDGAALERLRAAGIPMSLTQGTLEEFEAPAGSFDSVLLLRSVHHLPRLAEAFAKIATLLKPGGAVILADGLPLALLRSQEAARAARESLAPSFEHYRNWGSQQLLEFLAPLGLPLEVEEHHPITPATGNLWLLRLRRIG